jgi:LysM domain-containing protein
LEATIAASPAEHKLRSLSFAKTSIEGFSRVTAMQSSYSYKMDAVSSIDIEDGKPRTVTFTDDALGDILARDEQQHSGATNNPHEVHYYLNGIQIGDVTNNGTSDTDYAASITAQEAAAGTSGTFRNGASSGVQYANFDQSYDPLNGYTDDGGDTSYTVASGDTLQSIALAVWGDSSLWYVIADANGLSSGDTLTSGMTLLIPNKVENVSNSSTTFKPTDPNSIIGNVSPTIPKHQHSCGIIGQILMAVIAVVVSVFTAGAGLALVGAASSIMDGVGLVMGGSLLATSAGVAGGLAIGAVAGAVGSMVSQGFGVATGIQKSFNWGAVGMAALGSAIGAGVSETGVFDDIGNAIGDSTGLYDIGGYIGDALQGAASNAITQGIGVATGLQKKFDWAGVAAAGVSAGVGSAVGDLVSPLFNNGGSLNLGSPIANQGAVTFVAGMAGNIADAATRTLINGSDFGDNIVAALPDTIGQTIGSMIGNEIVQQQRTDDAISAIQKAVENKQIKPEAGQQLIQLIQNGGIWDGSWFSADPTKNPAYDPSNPLEKAVYDHVIKEWNNSPNSQAIATQTAVVAQLKSQYDGLLTLAEVSPQLIGSDLASNLLRTRATFNALFASVSAYFYDDIPQLDPLGFKRYGPEDPGALDKLGLLPENINEKGANYHAFIFADGPIGGPGTSYIVANRGTEDFSSDSLNMKANKAQNSGEQTLLYDDAMYVAERVTSAVGDAAHDNVLFTGHSLGGGLASAQALATDYKAIVFDPSGLHPNTVARFEERDELKTDFDADTKRLITAYVYPGNWLDVGQQATLGYILKPAGNVVDVRWQTPWSNTDHDTVLDEHGMDFMTSSMLNTLLSPAPPPTVAAPQHWR